MSKQRLIDLGSYGKERLIYNTETLTLERQHEDDCYGCTCDCGVHEAMRLTGKTAKELTSMAFPSRTESEEFDGYYLRMYFGEATGLFYRDQLAHEWRIGYDHTGVQLVVSTEGGFPIYPLEHTFDTGQQALEYLQAHTAELERPELPKAE